MKNYFLSPFSPTLLTRALCTPQDLCFYSKESQADRGSHQSWSLEESDEHITFEADAPGVQPENIEVTFEADVLSVRAKREQTNGAEKPCSRRSRSFEYRVKLPTEIEASSEPKATYTNGVVRIVFAKAAKVPNLRKIAVRPAE